MLMDFFAFQSNADGPRKTDQLNQMFRMFEVIGRAELCFGCIRILLTKYAFVLINKNVCDPPIILLINKKFT